MKNAFLKLISPIIVVAMFVAGAVLYPELPERMAIHFNLQGEADGFSGKIFGTFIIPIVAFLIWALFLIIPKIDPLKANIKKFERYYFAFASFVIIFLANIFAVLIQANLGYNIDFLFAITPALAVLFIFIGIILKKTKRNWFIGVRTPWTMQSDIVWKETHEVASRLFIISGIVAFLGMVEPQYSLYFIFVPIVISALYSVIYSYFSYKRN